MPSEMGQGSEFKVNTGIVKKNYFQNQDPVLWTIFKHGQTFIYLRSIQLLYRFSMISYERKKNE